MLTAQSSAIDQIGDAAGLVWHHLNQNGSCTLSQLAKEVEAPRDVIMQAVGWLAREGKVLIDEERNKKLVSLRS